MFEVVLPETVSAIITILTSNGFEAYVVGGCVRDSLLGIEPHDWDICTSAKPEEVKILFKDDKIIDTGIKHGTITLCLQDGQYEITTFRTDGKYSDNRRPDNVKFVTDIKTDLSRRDFTINAMAYNNAVGLIDPFGGKQDIENKVISCVGNANDRFNEDALRIMRAIRFASVYNFSIDEKTSKAIHDCVSMLNIVAAERINAELCKTLLGTNISQILFDYSDVVTQIIPELKPCIGFEQNNKYHQYTIYEHIVHAVNNYKGDDVCVLVALLLHDIGKPQCYSEDKLGGHFYGHPEESEKMASKIVERLRFDNKSKHDIVELVTYHDYLIAPSPRSVRRALHKLGEKQFFRLADIRLADMKAHAEKTQEKRIQNHEQMLQIAKEEIEKGKCFSLKDLAINGNDIKSLGIPEGKMVGFFLELALNAVISGITDNTKDHLMRYIDKWKPAGIERKIYNNKNN